MYSYNEYNDEHYKINYLSTQKNNNNNSSSNNEYNFMII